MTSWNQEASCSIFGSAKTEPKNLGQDSLPMLLTIANRAPMRA